MADVVYTSRVRIERRQGPLRLAHLPAESEPVTFGVHGEIAEHYGVSPDVAEPHATTIDYVVAAAGGWLVGTFGGALEARHVDASAGRLIGEVLGEVEVENKVLILRRIRVIYRLQAPAEQRETIEHVHGFHARFCPVYRSLTPAIEITTRLVMIAE